MSGTPGKSVKETSAADLLRDHVGSYEGRLSAADKKILGVLTREPVTSAWMTVREVADAAGVHAASVVRLVQKLGFDGFGDFRAHARTQFHASANPANRVRSSLTRDCRKTILQSLVEREAALLLDLPNRIDQESIDRMVEMVRTAGRRLILGEGHGTDLARLFARRLMRSGYDARALGHYDWELRDILNLLAPGDLLVAVVLRQLEPYLCTIVAEARNRGCAVVALGDLNALTLEPEPDLVLAASRGRGQDAQTLSVPMAIANTVILELARQDGGVSLTSLDRLATLRKALDP